MASRTIEMLPADRDTRGGDDFVSGVSQRLTPQRDGSYSLAQLQRFLVDVRYEPDWRKQAEIESAFYDSDQLDTERVRMMRELGIPPVVINVSAPAIDSVAGLEALSRASLKVEPETDDSYDIAQGLNVEFKKAQRLTRFNERAGDVYKGGLTIGLNWLAVTRNPDPYGYDYRCRIAPWREMRVDYRSREPDYGDARYIIRSRWFDADVLAKKFPRHAKTLEKASSTAGSIIDWSDFEALGLGARTEIDLVHSADAERRFTLEEDEWRQVHRGRLRLYEVLYWVPRIAEVLKLRNGRVIELNRNDPYAWDAVRRGMARYAKGPTKQWRQAFYSGPIRLVDRPLETNMSHYIPFCAFRRDSDGAPYGLMRRMRSVQEAINARMSRMLYDLASRKIIVDEDAVDDHAQTAREMNKVTSYVILRADRTGESGLVMMPSTDTTPITFQLMQQHHQDIYNVTGLHPEFKGQTLEAGRSGRAIQELVEQTTHVLGGVADNFKVFKQRAGEQLLAYQMADLGEFDDLAVETGAEGIGERAATIVLNARNAVGLRDNDVLLARIRVALGSAPDTVTYRQQQFQQLVEIIKSLPENLQAVFADFIVRSANLPHADEMLERLRQVTGFGPEPRDPQAREELREQKAQQAELQSHMQQLEIALQEAELEAKRAKARLEAAKALKTEDADTDLTEAKTLLELARTEDVERDQERKDRETRAKTIAEAARLKAASQPPKPAAKTGAKTGAKK